MNVTVAVEVDRGLIDDLTKRIKAAQSLDGPLTAAAIKLKERAQANSSGRPGPNIITYQFHDAWTWAVGGDSATVANGSVYAARLEFGFVGVDSLGRHYSQPPYPSLQPAMAESETLLGDELAKAVFG